MPLIDLSPGLRNGLAVWPGDTPFDHAFTARIAPGSPVNVSRFVLSAHTGSHADAPFHFTAAGEAIDALPLERFLGPCRLVDVSDRRGPIGPDAVLPKLDGQVERVLIRQYRRHPEAWDPNFRGLDATLAPALAARGVRLIGVDAASVDPADSKTLDAHHALHAAGILILEGLVLTEAAPGDYELIALPLKLAGSDGAPVRAVLRTLP